MNKELTQIFKNNEFGNVRVVLVGEKEYFVGKDIADALGYSNSSKAVSTHCKHIVKTMIDIAHSQNGNLGKTETSLIAEGDVYRLIIKSKLATAEKFEEWIMDEVIPAIRKHGLYITDEAYQEYLDDKPKFEARLNDAHEEILQLRADLEESDKANEILTAKYNDVRLMYQNCTNEVAEYVIYNLAYDKTGKINTTEAYNHYCRWCNNTAHYKAYDKKQFDELLLERMVSGHSIKKQGSYYLGVRFNKG